MKSIESRINGISSGLGFKELLERKTQELSGGQRSKIILGKRLLEKPDILLLDEPTNHLNIDAKEELKSLTIMKREYNIKS
ncbi:ATP-binding cassette domain-containing protein [Clostridium cadaveris]|nr:ATP-binding cassette domain-containing protein [Clostridium cadaveris]